MIIEFVGGPRDGSTKEAVGCLVKFILFPIINTDEFFTEEELIKKVKSKKMQFHRYDLNPYERLNGEIGNPYVVYQYAGVVGKDQ